MFGRDFIFPGKDGLNFVLEVHFFLCTGLNWNRLRRSAYNASRAWKIINKNLIKIPKNTIGTGPEIRYRTQ
jgi:hypothetical protein